MDKGKLFEKLGLHLHGLQLEVEAHLGRVERELVVRESRCLREIEQDEIVGKVVVGQLLDRVAPFLQLLAPRNGTHSYEVEGVYILLHRVQDLGERYVHSPGGGETEMIL